MTTMKSLIIAAVSALSLVSSVAAVEPKFTAYFNNIGSQCTFANQHVFYDLIPDEFQSEFNTWVPKVTISQFYKLTNVWVPSLMISN